MLIYKIINIVNDKVYIGQTTGTLAQRIRSYKAEYCSNKPPRPIIKAMKKYGWDKFRFSIVEDNILSKEELDKKEKEYIVLFNSLCSQNGYNIELGGNGIGKHAEETKKKISEAQKGSKNHMYGKKGARNNTSKPVIELTSGKIFESASLASEYFHLNFSHICASARGTRGSTGGKVFRYIDDGDIIIPENRAKIKTISIKDSIQPELLQYV